MTGVAMIAAVIVAIASLDFLVQGVFLIRLPFRSCSDQFFPKSVHYIETFYSGILAAAILAALVAIKILILKFLPRETEEDRRKKKLWLRNQQQDASILMLSGHRRSGRPNRQLSAPALLSVPIQEIVSHDSMQ